VQVKQVGNGRPGIDEIDSLIAAGVVQEAAAG
jgi:hypothetical protein